jgi:Tfp pilus assembly protein PilN
MNYLNLCLGNFWWTIEISTSGTRLIRWLKNGKSIEKLDYFEGTLEECFQYLILHGSSLDGVLVAEDSIPYRFLSLEEYHQIQSSPNEANFLPGISVSELQVIESLSENAVAICGKRRYDDLMNEIKQQGFIPISVVPAAFLYASYFPLDKKENGQIFIRVTKTFFEIWVFNNGAFLSCHRFLEDANRLDVFLNQFYTNRYPLSNDYSISLIENEILDATTVSAKINKKVNSISLQEDILKRLAEDAWMQKMEKSSMGRLREIDWFRKILKGFGLFSLASLALVVILWLLMNVYSFYTQKDKLELEKKIEARKEMALITQKLEKDRIQLESLLMQRTRHSSSLTELVSTLPDNMWLSQIEIQGNRISIQGYASQEEEVSLYLSRLEKSSIFTRVRLKTTEKTSWKKKVVVRFDLVAEEAL